MADKNAKAELNAEDLEGVAGGARNIMDVREKEGINPPKKNRIIDQDDGHNPLLDGPTFANPKEPVGNGSGNKRPVTVEITSSGDGRIRF